MSHSPARIRAAVAVFTSVLLLVPGVARAVTFDLVSWTTEADVGLQVTGGLVLTVPASTVNGPTSNFGVPLSAGVGAGISADAFADAGLLKADASAAANAFLGVPGSFAFGGGDTRFKDYFIPESTLLPAGTPVTVLGTLAVSGTFDAEGVALGPSAGGLAMLQFFASQSVFRAAPDGSIDFTSSLGQTHICAGTLIDGVPAGCSFGDGVFPVGGPPLPFQTTSTFTADLVIGQIYALIGVLNIFVDANASVADLLGSPDSTASFTASLDALHTGHTFLDPLGDFSIVSASGHDYSSLAGPPGGPPSVPGPGSAALLTTGLAMLCCARFCVHPRKRPARLRVEHSASVPSA
jgi:hypothetical protein